MAAELMTPLDELTGIPLPILPRGELNRDDPNTNWHHAWHADSAPQLQGVGGRALRHSRVQLVHEDDHNHGDKQRGKLTYHDHYIGPPLPTNDLERLRLCVLSAAAYMPDEAIDLWGDDGPRAVRMSPLQKGILQMPQVPRPMNEQDEAWVRRKAKSDYDDQTESMMSFESYLRTRIEDFNARRRRQAAFGLHHVVYQYDPLREFLKSMVLRQDLSDIREARVDEFLSTRDEDRKLRLGRWLIGEAVHRSTDHIRMSYSQFYRDGRLHPAMPPDVSGLVVWKLGLRPYRNNIVKDHEQTLRQRLGVAA